MDTLGKQQEEREHIREILIKKFGSQEIAADKIGISKFTLSRTLSGKQVSIDTIVLILKSTGHLEEREYRMPETDWRTFTFLNGIINFSLK